MMRSFFSLCCAIACISGFALPFTALGQPVSDLGTVQVNSIGHTFFPGGPPGGGPVPRSFDYLIDQSQSSGGGGTVGPVLANLDVNSQFSLTITAPPGEQFFIDVPTLQTVRLTGTLNWSNYLELGGSSLPMTVVLVDSGIDPIQSTFNLDQNHSGFQFIFSITLSADTSFTAIQFNATVPAGNVGIGSKMYFPSLNDQVAVDYFPPSNADPGPVAFLVPEPGVNLLLFLGFLLVVPWRIKQSLGGLSSARDFCRGQR